MNVGGTVFLLPGMWWDPIVQVRSQVNMYRNSKCANISDCRPVCCINFANSSTFSQVNLGYKIHARLKGKVSLQLLLLFTNKQYGSFSTHKQAV